jgi:hypothetical protein
VKKRQEQKFDPVRKLAVQQPDGESVRCSRVSPSRHQQPNQERSLTTIPPPDLPPGALELSAFIEDRVLETSKLFGSDGERSGALFKLLKRRGQAWETPKVCSFRGCSKRSIPRSHTIQRSGPLGVIAEANHVLTPRWTSDGMTLKLIGLKDASTFAGFCQDHEALFDPFETTGVIASDRDLELQVFRSLCREIARQQHDLKHLRETRTDLVDRLDREVRAEAARLQVGFQSYRFEGGAFGPVDQAITEREETLRWLEATYDDHFPAIEGSAASRLAGEATQINLALPVALSGMVSFDFDGKAVTAVVGVIPQAGGSLVYMIGCQDAETAISTYLANKDLDLCLLDIVEAWMVRGTDHWFLKPSVWSAIPEDRQAALLHELGQVDHGVAYPPSTSIFDDLRKAALAVSMNPAMPPNLQAYVAKHRAKLLSPA